MDKDEYDKIVANNKANQPKKCNGCRYEHTNGSYPCMPRNRICDKCPYQEFKMKDKCKCGKISSHTTFKNGNKVRLCCNCYVKAGNAPADWHFGCMQEAGRIKDLVAWNGESGTKRSSLVQNNGGERKI